MSIFDATRGQYPSSRRMLGGLAVFFALFLSATPVTPAHAAYAAFVGVTFACAWIASREALLGVAIERNHRERVFEDDPVTVSLRITQSAGLPQTLVLIEDQFMASLSVHHRQLIPMMSPKWEARVHYVKQAEKHRGLYLLGPVLLWAADPLGVFVRRIRVETVTRLIVYPRAIPLPGYHLPGPHARSGPALETAPRLGQAEEIIGVRPYQAGDPPSRIHWRTSARRRELHVIELNTQIQSEVMLFLDMTHRARFGTGSESTTETAIGCAVSILTEAAALRHRFGLVWTRERTTVFPSGIGMAHLHLLLDRLAVVTSEGDQLFWPQVAPLAARLAAGSRAIFILPSTMVDPQTTANLVRGLTLRSVAVDFILIDEAGIARIYRHQQPTLRDAPEQFQRLRVLLELAGARVMPLTRGQNAGALLPRAASA